MYDSNCSGPWYFPSLVIFQYYWNIKGVFFSRVVWLVNIQMFYVSDCCLLRRRRSVTIFVWVVLVIAQSFLVGFQSLCQSRRKRCILTRKFNAWTFPSASCQQPGLDRIFCRLFLAILLIMLSVQRQSLHNWLCSRKSSTKNDIPPLQAAW